MKLCKLADIFFRCCRKLHISRIVYRLLPAACKKRCALSEEKARQDLEAYWPNPSAAIGGSCIVANNIEQPHTCDLQIVVPCYNVEQYAEQCIESILNQKTKYSIYICLINDGSTDGTLRVLKKYQENSYVSIMSKENGGAASARNIGLNHIRGKYLMFVDADDFIEAGSIDCLMDCAISNDADIVQGGFNRVTNDEKQTFQKFEDRKIENNEITGYPCGKVYKASLFGNISFPSGFWFEDTMNHFLVHQEKVKAYSVSNIVYAYRWNDTGATAQSIRNPRSVESYWVTELLVSDMHKLGFAFNRFLLDKMLRQFLMNLGRIQQLPIYIQKCVFVLQCELLEREFSTGMQCSPELQEVYSLFQTRNFWGLKFYMMQ